MGNKSSKLKKIITRTYNFKLNIPCCVIQGYLYFLPLKHDLIYPNFSTVGIDLSKIYDYRIKKEIKINVEGKDEIIIREKPINEFHINFSKAYERIKNEGSRYPEPDPCHNSDNVLRVYFIRPEMEYMLKITEYEKYDEHQPTVEGEKRKKYFELILENGNKNHVNFIPKTVFMHMDAIQRLIITGVK